MDYFSNFKYQAKRYDFLIKKTIPTVCYLWNMKIKLMAMGRTSEKYLVEGIAEYQKRLRRYWPFEYMVVPDLKGSGKMPAAQVKIEEGKRLMQHLASSDHLVLLDEKGKNFTSPEWAAWMQKKANTGLKTMVLAIGGPYGFSEEVYARCNEKLALSTLTFSHQMVRLFAIEQIYRGMTILHHEPYHHE